MHKKRVAAVGNVALHKAMGEGSVKVITDMEEAEAYFTLNGGKISFDQKSVDHVLLLNGLSFKTSYWGVYFEYNGLTKVGQYLNRAYGMYTVFQNADKNGFEIDESSVSSLERFVLIVKV